MRHAIALLALAQTAVSTYQLVDSYAKDTFFGNFTAFSDKDPTNGYVKYQTYGAATSKNLIKTVTNAQDASYITVDPNSKDNAGRDSVRISSTKSYNKGLFIVDLLHMPKNTCGSWPAFWLLGPNWPNGGEIDILEGANAQKGNQMTLHTSSGCSVQNTGFKGKLEKSDCGPDEKNTGCAITSQDQRGFGDGFNKGNGGVYAAEWSDKEINIWFHPRESIPADIQSNQPNPSSWGTPAAKFAGCDIPAHFKDMKIIFNTAFCGDWAGKNWVSDGCAASTGVQTCEEYVGQHPEAFKESFWLVNYVKVFQIGQQGGQSQQRKMKRGSRHEYIDSLQHDEAVA